MCVSKTKRGMELHFFILSLMPILTIVLSFCQNKPFKFVRLPDNGVLSAFDDPVHRFLLEGEVIITTEKTS